MFFAQWWNIPCIMTRTKCLFPEFLVSIPSLFELLFYFYATTDGISDPERAMNLNVSTSGKHFVPHYCR